MADQLQLRGGTTAQHATFTGALREVTVDTDKKTVVVHDGSTAGGNPLLRQDLSNLPAGTIDNADINASAGIVDTKLATIATAGKVSNSATTATSANTANAIVARDASGNFDATSINGGPLAGTRNRIINGNFDFWQRGTSFSVTTTNTYTADRWLVFFDGTGATRTISQQSFTPGQTDVPNEPKYFLRFAQSVAGSGSTFNSLDQRIEDVRTFAGQQVTLSFWAKAAASATMPNVQLIQGFGTGGSPSANTSTTVTSNVAVTTSWQRFSYQVNVPSISGKTLGTSTNNSTIALVLTMPLNATFTIDIAQVQLEPGTVATPFERRPIGTELALCERYYEKSYNTDVALGTVTTVGIISYRSPNLDCLYSYRFKTKKRVTATTAVYNPATGTVGEVRDADSGVNYGAVGSNASASGVTLSMSGVSGAHIQFHYTASAEL
jgi:hypothetical protein